MALQPKDTTKSFGVGSLESRILCTHHNNRLSDLDAEALTAFDAFEVMLYAAARSAPRTTHLRRGRRPVRAVDAERPSAGVSTAAPCGPMVSEVKDVEPPLDWLKTLYAHPLPEGSRPLLPGPSGDELIHHRRGDRENDAACPRHPRNRRDIHGLQLHGCSALGSPCWRPAASPGRWRRWPDIVPAERLRTGRVWDAREFRLGQRAGEWGSGNANYVGLTIAEAIFKPKAPSAPRPAPAEEDDSDIARDTP